MPAPDPSRQREALSIMLPAGWQRIRAERLLNAALATSLTEGDAIVPSGQVRAARDLFWRTREVYHDEHVVFAAIRLRVDTKAIDQLTLALPRVLPAGSRDSNAEGSASLGPSAQLREDVEIGDLQAVRHRSVPVSPPAEVGGIHRSVVQLVFVVAGSDRGAVLTVLSSMADAEDLLQRDAEEIAASVQLTRSLST
jgi:hypothetical protein